MADLPTPALVMAAMDRIDAAAAETPEGEAPAATEADAKLAPDTQAEATTDTATGETEQQKEPASTVDLATIVKTVKEKGARSPEAKALLDSLDDDAKSTLEALLLPKLQSKLSTRTNELSEAQKVLSEMRRMNAEADARHDELMTAGLSDEEKRAYFEAKAKKKQETDQRDNESRARETNRRLGTLWQIVHSAGLPVDMGPDGLPREDADPAIKQLWQAVWDNPDFDDVVRHFVTQAPQLAEARKGSKDKKAEATTTANGQKTYSRDEVDALVRKAVNEAMLKSGMLAPDTGRPGGAGGGRVSVPKSDRERRQLVERMLTG